MTGMGWIGSLIIGAVSGWIAEKIMKSDQSLLMTNILGIAGALVLNWLLIAILGTTLGGWIGQLIVAAAGACLLIFVGRLIRGKA